MWYRNSLSSMHIYIYTHTHVYTCTCISLHSLPSPPLTSSSSLYFFCNGHSGCSIRLSCHSPGNLDSCKLSLVQKVSHSPPLAIASLARASQSLRSVTGELINKLPNVSFVSALRPALLFRALLGRVVISFSGGWAGEFVENNCKKHTV